MSPNPVIVWFRQDLRLDDHPALTAAVRSGCPILPVYVWSPESEGAWPVGAAARWWLHHSLRALDRDLRERDSRLIIKAGDPLEVLAAMVREFGVETTYWHHRWEPDARRMDERVRAGLERLGVKVWVQNGSLLFEPAELANRQGQPYRVFTPFWKTCLARGEALSLPLGAPGRLARPRRWPESLSLEHLGLLPAVDWAAGMRAEWTPGAAGAEERLRRFLDGALADYASGRERPYLAGTSRLSPHLHFGELSPRRLWHAVRQCVEENRPPGIGPNAEAFLRQLLWREFAHHLLYHFPHTTQEPLRPEFARFPWSEDPGRLRAWQRGRTSIPLVDAGMRELWATGWMHNRVRMIVASLLVKNMMIPWTVGARWFWDTLVDADLANNTLGWQWVAGCGADAAPFFRIFNPLAQGARFDPQGDYVRRWVPELSRLPAEWIHRPHQAPGEVLNQAGVVLDGDYPRPVVNLESSRRTALISFARLKGKA